LILQGTDASIELIAALPVRAAGLGRAFGSAPERAAFTTLGTARHTSVKVASVTAPVDGSTSLMLGGKGRRTRIRPYWRRVL